MTRKLDHASQLPLTPVVLHILLALTDGERHGYAIAQEVEATTNGQVRMGPGTLYGSIQRMLAADLIDETSPRRRAADDDERRRYYRMTAYGRRVLALELERLAAVVRLARSRHLLPERKKVTEFREPTAARIERPGGDVTLLQIEPGKSHRCRHPESMR